MARGHVDLPPTVPPVRLSKAAIFESLAKIDWDLQARQRILGMESGFRKRINTHISALPTAQARFQKFSTSPFVLMFYSKQRGYKHVSEIEKDIVPAKVFSSMETSAGRMVEEVVLPFYGWTVVPTQMHSTESLLDGRKLAGDGLAVVTLKSGPRCLNDEMAQNIGRDIAANVVHGRLNTTLTESISPMGYSTARRRSPIRRTGMSYVAWLRCFLQTPISRTRIRRLGRFLTATTACTCKRQYASA